MDDSVRTMRRRRSMVSLTTTVAVVSGSCATAPAYLPPAPEEVTVAVREYQMELGSAPPAGQVIFRVRNVGTVAHELRLSPWPEEFPSVEEALADQGPGRVVGLLARVNPQGPGEDAAFAVHLEAGRYALACFLKDPDGRTHAEKGMATEISVG